MLSNSPFINHHHKLLLGRRDTHRICPSTRKFTHERPPPTSTALRTTGELRNGVERVEI